MAHQWKAGDLARCVDDSPCPYCGQSVLALRSVYRVSAVFVEGDIDGNGFRAGPGFGIGLCLLVRQCCHEEQVQCWRADRFRPILPAEPAFTDAMRALKLRVEA